MLEEIPSENVAPEEAGDNSLKKSKKIRAPVSAAALLCRAGSKMKNKSIKKNNTLLKHTKKPQSLNTGSKKEVKHVVDANSPKRIKDDEGLNNDSDMQEGKSMTIPEEWSRPFKLGWKREIVYRGVQNPMKQTRQCDIYYFAPDNTKLRSLPMIMEYLAKTNSDLAKECFSFSKQKIYNEPQEIIRNAGEKGGVNKRLNENNGVKVKKESPKLNVSLQGIENVSKTRGKSKKDKESMDDAMKEDVKKVLSNDVHNEAKETLGQTKKKLKRKLEKPEVIEKASKKIVLTDEAGNPHSHSSVTECFEICEPKSPVESGKNIVEREEEDLICSTKRSMKRKFVNEKHGSEEVPSKRCTLLDEVENSSDKDAVEDNVGQVPSQELFAAESVTLTLNEPNDFKEDYDLEEKSAQGGENYQITHGNDDSLAKEVCQGEISITEIATKCTSNIDSSSELEDDKDASNLNSCLRKETFTDESPDHNLALNCDTSEPSEEISSAILEEKENLACASQGLNVEDNLNNQIIPKQQNSLTEDENQVCAAQFIIINERQRLEEDMDRNEITLTENKHDEVDKAMEQVKIRCNLCMHEFDAKDKNDLSKEIICQLCVTSAKENEPIQNQDHSPESDEVYLGVIEDINVNTKSGKSLVDMQSFVVDYSILKVLDISKPFYLDIENGLKRLIEPGSTSVKGRSLHISLCKPIPHELTQTMYVNDTSVSVVVTTKDEKQTLNIRV